MPFQIADLNATGARPAGPVGGNPPARPPSVAGAPLRRPLDPHALEHGDPRLLQPGERVAQPVTASPSSPQRDEMVRRAMGSNNVEDTYDVGRLRGATLGAACAAPQNAQRQLTDARVAAATNRGPSGPDPRMFLAGQTLPLIDDEGRAAMQRVNARICDGTSAMKPGCR